MIFDLTIGIVVFFCMVGGALYNPRGGVIVIDFPSRGHFDVAIDESNDIVVWFLVRCVIDFLHRAIGELNAAALVLRNPLHHGRLCGRDGISLGWRHMDASILLVGRRQRG